jgi:hypothetical protein
MRIAIDINDVVRDYSNNFVKYYIEGYDRNFDLSNFEFWTNDLSILFPFKSKQSYNNFIYNDYAFELYGKCRVCSRGLEAELNTWTEQTLKDLDIDEDIDVMFVSPMEYGASIGNTYFFLSKLGTKIREVYFPTDSSTIWDRCDILITANPNLLNTCPEGKRTIKIKTEYNKEVNADYAYNSFSEFLTNEENTIKLFNEQNL